MKFLLAAALAIVACLPPIPVAGQDDPIASEMNRHNQEIARLLQREPFRFTALPGAESVAPAATAAVPQSPFAGGVVTASTCDCSRTGVCICDPATCRCASCANGQARMAGFSSPATSYFRSYATVAAVPRVPLTSVTQQFPTATGLFGNRVGVGTVTATNQVDRKGRQRIYYSGVNKRTARAMAAGVQ